MNTDQYIALGGAVSTLLGVIITWLAARRSQPRKELTYRVRMDSLISSRMAASGKNLVIHYGDDLLPHPVLLSVDIANTGNVVVENPPIEVEAVGTPTYVIPGYFEDLPPGYEDLWSIERTDAESCAITLTHINPGQTARARMLMDELPNNIPIFKCPMAGLALRRGGSLEVKPGVQVLLDIVAPKAGALLKMMR
jgi:hypothetical protein